MSSLHFEYEIPVEEYVAAQLLYRKLRGRKRSQYRAAFWILAGVALLVIGFNTMRATQVPECDFAVFLLAAIGSWWAYAGIWMLFPARHFRRSYRSFEYAGKSFRAEADENGFVVTGEVVEWRVKWIGVSLKAENEKLILLFCNGVMFIFGKRFLTPEQQVEIRRLSGLGQP